MYDARERSINKPREAVSAARKAREVKGQKGRSEADARSSTIKEQSASALALKRGAIEDVKAGRDRATSAKSRAQQEKQGSNWRMSAKK